MSEPSPLDVAIAATPSFESLRRPLNAEERRALWGEQDARDPQRLLNTLAIAFEQGDGETQELAAAMLGVLIQRMMARRLLDPQNGPVPRLARDIKKAGRAFNGYLR